MQSVFMGKNAAHWLMNNIEYTVIGVHPKHFFLHLGKVILLTLCNEVLILLVSS